MLYDSYPTYQYLTSEVNRNTNVFPSLHASLATTVALFAVRTREFYPRWVPIAIFLAISVSVSTMYLAIHWATDVIAGVALAVISVRLARYSVEHWAFSERIGALLSEYWPREN
ncbi:MAG: phosphatase PAP2 family protein [Natrialbaceae archaeon]|nr:phosphatase PAP2 family protein [Natrialbaceae archaeon]